MPDYSLKAEHMLSSERRQEHRWKPWQPSPTGFSTGRLDVFLLLDYCNDTIWRENHIQVSAVVYAVKKKNPEINNTIYLCSITHPTYCAIRHHKITDLFLAHWATQGWFLTHQHFIRKPKKDISSTCASVWHMYNHFLEGQSSAQKALRPYGGVSTARPKEMVQCLSKEFGHLLHVYRELQMWNQDSQAF